MTWLKARFATALAVLTAVLTVLGAVYGKGRKDANLATSKKNLEDYADERKRIDTEISSVGATDSERVRLLQDIAKRRGGS
jgi:hypothetical protein